MVELIEVVEFIEMGGRPYVSDVRIRASDETILIYVPRVYLAEKVSTGHTSLRQLRNLKKFFLRGSRVLLRLFLQLQSPIRNWRLAFFSC